MKRELMPGQDLARGFTLTASEPHELWGDNMVGQTYEPDL